MRLAVLFSVLTVTVLGGDCPRAPEPPGLEAYQSIPLPIPRTTHKRAALSGPANFIDEILFAAQDRDGVDRAPLCDDLTFLRRVTVDLTGRLPSLERILAFIEDSDPEKRAFYVDELLASESYVRRWSYWFGELYRNTGEVGNRLAAGKFSIWLDAAVRTDMPLDEMATTLITALGETYTLGYPNYILRQGGLNVYPEDRFDNEISAISTQFLGLDTNCISCHNGRGYLDNVNLFLSGKNRQDLWAFAAFMTQKVIGDVDGNADRYGLQVKELPERIYNANTPNGEGDRPPRAGGIISPAYLYTGETPDPARPRREELARMVTSDFQMARNFANRLWAHFMSVGLVEPLDGFDPARLDPDNPPQGNWEVQPLNPALLDALAQHLVDNGYSMRALIRTLVTSQTYQLSADYPTPWTPELLPYFPKRIVRPLTGEEILDKVSSSADIYGYDFRFRVGQRLYVPEYGGTYSESVAFFHELPDASRFSFFGYENPLIRTFGVGDRYNLERSDQPVATQSLIMMNSDFIHKRISAEPVASGYTYGENGVPTLVNQYNRVGRIARLELSDREKVRLLFLATLVREPTEHELAYARRLIGKRGFAKSAVDLAWVLVNYDEFRLGY